MVMTFDPATFEADVALKLIPTEQLPTIAQDALEAGFDGPHVLRMAIIDPRYGWEIDQALPPMLAELGCSSIPKKDAALRLAKQRAQAILAMNEDPLPSLPYFYRLMLSADHPRELIELGYLEDEFDFIPDDLDGQRKMAIRALEDFLSPEPYEKRIAEGQAAWAHRREQAKKEWPHVLASPTGRILLKEYYKERLEYIRPLFAIEVVAWILLGYASSSWRIALFGYAATLPVLLALPLWAEYRRLKRERRDLLLRMRVPEDQI